jgi:DNA-binding Lrp family transcriptional regulator
MINIPHYGVSSNFSQHIVTIGDCSKFKRLVIASYRLQVLRTKMSKSESISFVFANTKGEPTRIINQLKRISTISSITPVTGRFDLVIKLRTNELSKAFSTVEKIRSINGITSTQTAPSIESFTNPKNREDSNEPPLGFALVKIKGKIQSVLEKLKSFPNLVEAHLIPGEFDVVASFNGFSQDELMEGSVGKLSSINGITASETLISWTPSHTTQA